MMRNENSRRKGIARVVSMILIIMMLINMFTQAFATSEGGDAPLEIPDNLGIKSEVVYAEDNSAAEIKLDLSGVDSHKVKITGIKGPEETDLNIEDPKVLAKENGDYFFEITYITQGQAADGGNVDSAGKVEITVTVEGIVGVTEETAESEEKESGAAEILTEEKEPQSLATLLDDNKSSASDINENIDLFGLRFWRVIEPIIWWGDQKKGIEGDRLETVMFGDNSTTADPQKIVANLKKVLQVGARHSWPRELTVWAKNASFSCWEDTKHDDGWALDGDFSGWHKYKIRMMLNTNPSIFGVTYPTIEAFQRIYEKSKIAVVTLNVDDEVQPRAEAWELAFRWDEISYTDPTKIEVTYNANGGTIDGSRTKTVIVMNGETYGTMPTPIRENYTFTGWYTAASGGTQKTSTDKPSANETLYAHWTLNAKYTLTYNANKPSGVSSTVAVPDNLEAYAGSSYAALGEPNPLTFISDDKALTYTFKEWNTKADGTGIPYNKGVVVPANGNVTLYAVWTKSESTKYTLTYNANKPDGVSSTVTVPGRLEAYAGSSYVALGEPNPLTFISDDKALTYAFKEWNTKADGTGTPYNKGVVVPANGNVTLYAIWTKSENVKYTLTYNANKPDGVRNMVIVPDSSTAYAGDNYAPIEDPKPLKFISDDKSLTYNFKEWNTKADGTGIPYNKGAVVPANGNVTLYAVWIKNESEKYTLTYNANMPDGVSSMVKVPDSSTVYGGEIYAEIGEPNPLTFISDDKALTYTFKEWNTKADGTGASYPKGVKVWAVRNETLYAIWTKSERTKYTLTYNANRPDGVRADGTVRVRDPLTAYAGENFAALEGVNTNRFVTEDYTIAYTFKEWNTKEDGTGIPYNIGAEVPANGNVTLYAVWTKGDNRKLTLTYSANKPDGVSSTVRVPDSSTVYHYMRFPPLGEPNPLTVTSDDKSLTYTFKEWGQTADGMAPLSPGTVITPDYDHTMYAIWTKSENAKYTLTYNANKPDGVSSTVTVPDSSTAYAGDNYAALGETNPQTVTSDDKLSSYIFKEWNTKADGTGISYEKGAVIPVNGNVTLYACWEKDKGSNCPYVLNIKDYTLTDGRGNLIEENDNFSIFKGNDYDIFELTNPIFDVCTESNFHQLVVKGQNPKAILFLGDLGTNVEVSLEGIMAQSVEVAKVKSLTFKSINLIGSAMTTIVPPGLSLDGSIGDVVIPKTASVLLFNSSNTADDDPPYIQASTYTDIKMLDLIMNENVSEDTLLRVAGKLVVLPSGASRLAILDSADSTWLSGDIDITNEDRTVKYVRGIAEDGNDTAYLDKRFSSNNLYGNTFALSVESGGRTSAYGFYDKVRLPKEVKQVKASIPTRMIFNIYTNGSGNGDFGFIGPVSKMNNESYSLEDSLTIDSVTKEYVRTDRKLDIGFLGTMERTDEPSGYTLADYGKVTSEEMEQTVKKPKVCLEAVANGDVNNRIPIAQTDTLPITPVDWFVADSGKSSFQLVVPKAFQENTSGKRFYQMPSLLDGDTGEQKVSGHHFLRLAFSVSDTQN